MVLSAIDWWEGEKYLAVTDRRFIPLIEKYGPCALKALAWEDYYTVLLKGIISQHTAPKFAQQSFEKFADIYGARPEPEKVLAAPDGYLVSCGIHDYKIGYIKDLSRKVADGQIRLDLFTELPDGKIIKQLSQVRGLGRWTAELFLIIAMARPDVLPAEDYGLQAALKKAFLLNGATQKRAVMNAIGEPWRPWRSLATWYMWQYLGDS